MMHHGTMPQHNLIYLHSCAVPHVLIGLRSGLVVQIRLEVDVSIRGLVAGGDDK